MKRQPKVIGSQQPDIKLVSHRPGYSRKRNLLVLSLFVILGVVAYFAGHKFALQNHEDSSIQRDQLLKESLSNGERLTELKRQATFYKQEASVSKSAAELVRKENKDLLDRISELEEANAHYHRVLTPNKDDKGLVIGKLELKSTSVKQRFRYNFNLMQVSGRQRVQGIVYITLSGIADGVKTQFTLKELVENKMDEEGIRVGFRNFQSIDGELVLKEGFIPEQVEIVAQFSGRKAVRLRKVYDWLVQENNSDVGQG